MFDLVRNHILGFLMTRLLSQTQQRLVNLVLPVMTPDPVGTSGLPSSPGLPRRPGLPVCVREARVDRVDRELASPGVNDEREMGF